MLSHTQRLHFHSSASQCCHLKLLQPGGVSTLATTGSVQCRLGSNSESCHVDRVQAFQSPCFLTLLWHYLSPDYMSASTIAYDQWRQGHCWVWTRPKSLMYKAKQILFQTFQVSFSHHKEVKGPKINFSSFVGLQVTSPWRKAMQQRSENRYFNTRLSFPVF